VEASPSPTKYAAERLGLCDSKVRLPIVPMSEAGRKVVDDALVSAGILNG
jgi:4-hydroxy-tetrahydrodipicolinate synthase